MKLQKKMIGFEIDENIDNRAENAEDLTIIYETATVTSRTLEDIGTVDVYSQEPNLATSVVSRDYTSDDDSKIVMRTGKYLFLFSISIQEHLLSEVSYKK